MADRFWTKPLKDSRIRTYLSLAILIIAISTITRLWVAVIAVLAAEAILDLLTRRVRGKDRLAVPSD